MEKNRTPLPIENCQSWWKILCPKTWSQLERTDRLDMRRCPVCDKEVYYCESLAEAKEHKSAGHCFCLAAGLKMPADTRSRAGQTRGK